MRTPIRPLLLAAAVSFTLGLRPVPAHDAGPQMAEIARTFLGSLTPEQKEKASFKFEDEEERTNWHFIPRPRKGLPMKEMSPQSRLLAHALLNTGLSFRGAAKAVTIMSLEEVLYQIEGAADESKRQATREKRDPEKYYVSIFGEPSASGTWGWRIEGHHISMNFTLKDGQLVRATPSFFGSNPGEVRQGPLTGVRVLAREEELGRELVKSLSTEQDAKAIISTEPPKEMVTSAERKVNPLSPDGISEADLNDAQKKLLHDIVAEYLMRVRPDIAREALEDEKKAGVPLHFAWAGSKERGQGHYYRVQGKTFLLEYDNVQNEANHVHSVWRAFDADFGRDILGEHYKAEHK
ncbi:MAG: DUF3500 domain-containing protein [Verrucomicrobiaceae bacterium]|nr:DUF3500 domain-containing protein [Verrucomicrobiaceae bacterium]